MAKFNPDYKETQDPNYLNYSKGVDAPKASNLFEKLFEGASSVADSAVKVWDQANVNDIKQQATAGVDAIRTDMGIDTATDRAAAGNTLLPTQNGEPLPTAITSAQGEVGRLKDAYNQGKINDSYYWGRVNALAKSIRTQYPGYRDQIDQTFSGITGSDPANALRKAIQSDFNEAQAKLAQAGNKEDTFVNQNLPAIQATMPDYWKRKAEGKPYDFDQVRQGVQKYQASEASTRLDMLNMDYAAKKGTLDADTVYGKGTAMSNDIVSNMVNAGLQSLGTQVQAAMKSGKPLTPEDAQTFRANYAQMRAKAEVALNQLYNKPLGDDPTRTMASVLKDPAKLKAMKDNALANLDSMSEMLTNGQYGLFNQTALMTKAMTERDTAVLLKGSEALRKMKAAQEIAPAALNILFQRNPETMDAAAQAINSANISESVAGEGSLTRQIDNLKDPTTGKLRRGGGTRLLDDHVAILTGKEAPDVAKVNTAKAMFSDQENGFLQKFAPGDQLRVFQRLTSPEVTKEMIRLRSADPQTFENYKRWAGNSFSTLLKTSANTVQDINRFNADVQLKFDPATWQYVPSMTGSSEPNKNAPIAGQVIAGTFGILNNQLRMQEINNTLAPINAALKNLKPILGEDSKDPEALAKVLTGIDPKGPKEQGILQWLGNGLLNAVSGAAGKAGEALVPSAKGDTPKANPKADVKLASYSLDETQNALGDSIFEPAQLEGLQLDGSNEGSSGKYGKLLDLIGKGEAGGNYNRIYGKNREAPLGDMTVQEVMSLQNRMVQSGSPSTAVGKYQFINKTLGGLVRSLGLSPDEKFTPELQDRLAMALLRGRGLDAYESGRMTESQFLDNIAKEWAAVQNSSGRGHYDGDGLNRSSIKADDVLKALRG